MPTMAKKTAAKAPAKASGTNSKSHVAHHPSWVDMIKECIVARPEDARGGVSRPTIKKFVESKYRIELNAATASQLNRAITSGSEKGTFLLPKGPSGKVKLAPKARTDGAKENAKPVSKRPAASKTVATKPKVSPTKPVAAKKTVTARPAAKPKAAVTKGTSSARPTATPKKYTSAAKKAPVKKTPTKKAVPAKKASVTPKKTTTVKKGAAKKAVTGEAKKPAAKSKPKPTTSKATTTKTKPASKAKAAVAKKPTSKKA